MAKTLYDLALDYLNQGLPDINQAPRNTSPGTTSPGTTSPGTTTNPTDYFNLPAANILPSPGDDGGITNNIISTPEQGNTEEQQRLINEGIGLQTGPGSPIFAPGEMPLTQADINQFNSGLTADQGGGVGGSYDAAGLDIVENNPYGTNPNTGNPYTQPRTIADQNAVLGQTNETNNVLNNAKNLGIAGLDNVIEFGGKSIDVGKSLAGAALSSMVGIPGIGLALNALPERDQRQNELDNLYDVENGTIQSGLMKGYNPVSGNPLDPNFGLQDAYQDRIDTIEETIERKSDADKNYDKTELQNRINQLEIDKAKEADILNLYEGDINPEGTGDASIAEKIAENNRLGIPSDIGVEGEGRFSDKVSYDGQKIPQSLVDGFNQSIYSGGEGDISDYSLDELSRFSPVNQNRGSMFDLQYEPVSTPSGENLFGRPDEPVSTPSGVNPFADIDTGVGEFDLQDEPVSTPSGENLFGRPDEPVSTPSGVNPFADIDTGVGEFDTAPGTGINSIAGVDSIPSGFLTEEQYNNIQIPSDIPKDEVFLDERLGYVDADGNSIPNPNAIGDTVETKQLSDDLVAGFQAQLDSLEGQREQLDDLGIDPTEIDNAIEEIQDKIKGVKSNTVTAEKASFSRTGSDDGPAPAAPSAATQAAASRNESAYESAAYDAPAPTPAPAYRPATVQRPGSGGGDSGGGSPGGGGKVVCTMMNESYGFGSFRNKIWMKFHKDIAPEYQKGYHKIFLPLIKIAKTNRVVKKVLEHIAVHSTIDMRQATRGKTHLLGRVYRKIILPLCYFVGKHG